MSNALMTKFLAGIAATLVGLSHANDGDPSVLRSQKDAAREREWLLTPKGVVVFERKARATPTVVPLADWVWAAEAYMCPPDLALGPNGEALVTSNVVPILWRVDPISLTVTKHPLAVDAHATKDVGFTGLAYAPTLGGYFAVSEFGALWRIDPLLRRAQAVALEPALPRGCSLSASTRPPRDRSRRAFRLHAHAGGRQWDIHFAPDYRSAYARPSAVIPER